MYADVVFPLKVPPLTYKVPVDAPHDLKGRIVKTPLMGRSHYGIVVSVTDESKIGEKKNIREIQSIHHYFASESALSFLRWLSDYYLTPMGIAIKSSFFEEILKTINKSAVGSRQSAVSCQQSAVSSQIRTGDRGLETVCNSIQEKNYQSFLFHASSTSHEYDLLNKILSKAYSEIHGAIILVPEISQIERPASMLKNIFGERLCILHSRLTKKKRTEAITQIITGKSDVILGTRSAILAPLKDVSFIAVMSEHSPSYKAEEGLRYNARDAAVMRGFIEKSCVLLSSVCPSIESIYNSKIGKYILLSKSQQSEIKRPKIKIIDINKSRTFSSPQQAAGYFGKVRDKYKEKALTISRDILKEAKDIISKEGRFLFLVNRKGYSLIRCEDCGHIVQCKKCEVPLVFYKGKNIVRCHYCGYEETVPKSCEECNGFNIKPSGAGTERIKEELEEVSKTESLLIEKSKNAPKTISELSPDFSSFVIGTAYAAKKLRDEKFDAAALFNMDMLLSMPDFRAYERTFQEVAQISQMVQSDGTIFLQSWNPRNKILGFIRNYDFHGFYEHELSQRKMLDYPPFSRMILFNVFAKKDFPKILNDIQKTIGDTNVEGLELLGPVEIPSALKPYRHCIQILMKSKDRKLIHSAAENLLSELAKLKGAKINVNVDPLKI